MIRKIVTVKQMIPAVISGLVEGGEHYLKMSAV